MFIFKKVFLSKIIISFKEISIYKNYFKYRFRSYIVSLLDSLQYIEYIRSNRFKYNIINLIVIQLEILSSIYIRFKVKLEDAFEKQI